MRRSAFTLIELLVVLVLMALAAGLATLALRRAPEAKPPLLSLVEAARATAARRGETVYLRVAASGQWTMEGASSAAAGPIAADRVAPFPGVPLTIVVSPIGTCALDVRSAPAADVVRIDPFTCGVSSSR